MFTVFYANESNENIISTDYVFEDTIELELDKQVSILDKFIYLASMYRIVEDCSKDFEEFHVEKKQEFWRANKYLLNYVNSLYSFKEYIEHCYGKDSSAYSIVDGHFTKGGWYTFICNYRNRIIHQSTVLKDYDMNSGDVYICLEELVDAAIEQMNETKKGNMTSKRFIAFVEAKYVYATEINGKHYFDAKTVIGLANDELRMMSNDIFFELFNTEIKPSLEWLLSIMLGSEKKKYYDSYLVQDETHRNIRINFFIEDYLINLLFLLGKDFDAVKAWISFYNEKGYSLFYTQGKNVIDDVVDAVVDCASN